MSEKFKNTIPSEVMDTIKDPERELSPEEIHQFILFDCKMITKLRDVVDEEYCYDILFAFRMLDNDTAVGVEYHKWWEDGSEEYPYQPKIYKVVQEPVKATRLLFHAGMSDNVCCTFLNSELQYGSYNGQLPEPKFGTDE